jgi:predicted adenylyl cyclase CyaB
MIEVEKKFQPTEEQLEKLLYGAEFLNEKEVHDVYYDFSDFRLRKKETLLRKRGEKFELKVYKPEVKGQSRIADEYYLEDEIKERIGVTEGSLVSIIDTSMEILCDFKTLRRKYSKDGFIIDVDKTDYGFEVIEVEKEAENYESVPSVNSEILEFVREFGIEIKDLPLKTEAYLMTKRPEVYKEIFSGRDDNYNNKA